MKLKGLILVFIMIFALSAATLVFIADSAIAQTTGETTSDKCVEAEVEIVVREPGGEFLPGISYEIFEQTYDADGSAAPYKRVAGGKTSDNTGIGIAKFVPKADYFAVHVWHLNKEVGDFWFFNELKVPCGSTQRYTMSLSGISVVFRDTQKDLIKDKKYQIFAQDYDVDDNPIHWKSDLVANLDTSLSGGAIAYVSSRYRSMAKEGQDFYVMETTGPKQGSVYTKWDVQVSDRRMTNIEYIFSDMELIFTDSAGNPFPAKTKIGFYEQDEDQDGKNALGKLIRTLETDDQGKAIIEHPAGIYAVAYPGADGKTQEFYDLEMIDQERASYTLRADGSWEPANGACAQKSNIIVSLKTSEGAPAAGLNIELWQEKPDAGGTLIGGTKIYSGKTDDQGRASFEVAPDPRRYYALHVYDKNANAGDYWFYDELKFACGENKNVAKVLERLIVILRSGEGKLLQDQKFSIYTQERDADGKLILAAKDLVANSYSTGPEGAIALYLPARNQRIYDKHGTYVMTTALKGGAAYAEYNISMESAQDRVLDYRLSDASIRAKTASGRILGSVQVDLYEQAKGPDGLFALGKKVASAKTDAAGYALIAWPAGYYALAIKDDAGKQNIFYNRRIKPRTRTSILLDANSTRISVANVDLSKNKAVKQINIYTLKNGLDGYYYKDKRLKSFPLGPQGYAEVSLAPGPYIAAVTVGKKEYASEFYAENGKLQTIKIAATAANEERSGKQHKITIPKPPLTLAERLRGYILLQVEGKGEAWYVDPVSLKRYYLKNGTAAYTVMHKFGLGITNSNLDKLPVGWNPKMDEFDYDGDWLPDKLELAIGTDMYLRDTDRDGHPDGEELKEHFNPKGAGKLPIDMKKAESLAGRILLQVQANGEAWYINPRDRYRYYMKDGDSAYQIMRYLSLGITNEKLDEIEEGEMN